MATLEELTVEAQAEIDAAKPLYAQVNNERSEFTDAEYDQAVTDLANSKFDQQENGYKRARQEAYPSFGDQLDMLWHAIDQNELDKTSDFYIDLKAVKDANPKPS